MRITRAIGAYRDHLALTRAPHTVIAYTTSLKHFITWAATEHLADANQLTTQHLVEYARWVKVARELADTTWGLYITAVNRFYAWLLDENLAGFTESQYHRLQRRIGDLKGRRHGRTIPETPEEWAVQAAIEAAYDRPRNGNHRRDLKRWRDIAIIESLRCTGARPSELLGLTRGDLNLGDRSTIVGAKGGDKRKIHWDKRGWTALTRYLVNCGDLPDGTPLFLAHHRGLGDGVDVGEGISKQTMWAVINKLSEEAGLERTLSPKDFRHRYATGLLAATRNLALTQEAMGHKDPQTTRIYAKVTDSEIRAAQEEASERGLI